MTQQESTVIGRLKAHITIFYFFCSWLSIAFWVILAVCWGQTQYQRCRVLCKITIVLCIMVVKQSPSCLIQLILGFYYEKLEIALQNTSPMHHCSQVLHLWLVMLLRSRSIIIGSEKKENIGAKNSSILFIREGWTGIYTRRINAIEFCFIYYESRYWVLKWSSSVLTKQKAASMMLKRKQWTEKLIIVYSDTLLPEEKVNM